MQEEIERNEELIKQYENRALLAEYNARKAQLLAKMESDLNQLGTEADLTMEIEKLKEQLKEAKKPAEKKK